MTALPVVLNEQVLVLNRFYTAIRVISARRAFTMLCRQAAEIIAVEGGQYITYDLESWTEIAHLQQEFEPDAHAWVRPPRPRIALPRTTRLLCHDRLHPPHLTHHLRPPTAPDSPHCQYCAKGFPTRELTIDHVVPRVLGGLHSWANLVCACVRCNARKGGRTPAQAHIRLIRKPVKPRRNPVITLRLGEARYRSWRAFLDEAYWTVELRD